MCLWLAGCVRHQAGEEILVFAGAAMKPPLEEISNAFEERTGIRIISTFGGSGYVLSQMILSKQGDIYLPASSDYMELAKRKGVIFPETEKRLVYLVPVINVQKGNPKNITGLKDLTKPGLKVVIANPESVCVGVYAVEIIEKNLTASEKEGIKRNIVSYAESCEKTASAISMKTADAAIGWHVFYYWAPDKIENIPLKPSQIPRIGYVPVAISKFTKDTGVSQKFIDFLLSEESKRVFRKYHYFTSPEEAFALIGEEKPVGGEYTVPGEWIGNKREKRK